MFLFRVYFICMDKANWTQQISQHYLYPPTDCLFMFSPNSLILLPTGSHWISRGRRELTPFTRQLLERSNISHLRMLIHNSHIRSNSERVLLRFCLRLPFGAFIHFRSLSLSNSLANTLFNFVCVTGRHNCILVTPSWCSLSAGLSRSLTYRTRMKVSLG